MKINVMRIDDRLIHGQIVTSWMAEADAKVVIVADTIAAGDEMQKMLLKMATPSSVELKLLTIDEAAALLHADTSDQDTLLIVRGPAQALELLDKGFKIDTINVGNISMKKGKKKFLHYVWLNEDEVAALKALGDRGVRLDVRSVPSDRSQDAIALLEKAN